jgi:hypothetical protein
MSRHGALGARRQLSEPKAHRADAPGSIGVARAAMGAMGAKSGQCKKYRLLSRCHLRSTEGVQAGIGGTDGEI